ncbi:MAG: alpha-amylase family glycosyl hydrolase [Roseburia sp.]
MILRPGSRISALLNGSAIYYRSALRVLHPRLRYKRFPPCRHADLVHNEDFAHFVQLCHENGIRVVVDGVFNHTDANFSPFRISGKNAKLPRIRTGIAASTSAGEALLVIRSATRPGRGISNFRA